MSTYLIKIKAHEIWKKRQREGRDGTPENDWIKARKYLEKLRWEVFCWKFRKRFNKLGKLIGKRVRAGIKTLWKVLTFPFWLLLIIPSSFADPENTLIDSLLKSAQLLVLLGSLPLSAFIFFKYENLQRELSIQRLAAQTEISDINLNRQRTLRTEIIDGFEAFPIQKFPDGTKLFSVHLDFRVKNISDKTIEVPINDIRIYIGSITKANTNSEKHELHKLSVIYGPEIDIIEVENAEVVNWKKVYSEFTKSGKDIRNPNPDEYLPDFITIGDLGTGFIDPQEELGRSWTLLIRAKPEDYFAYILNIDYYAGDDEVEGYTSRSISTFSELSLTDND